MDDYLAKPYRGEDLRAALMRGAQRAPAVEAPPPAPPALVAPQAPIAECLDKSVLASLGSLQRPGAASLLERVVGLYLKHSPPQVEEVRAALAVGDAPTLRRAVHTLKSSSANVGAVRLSALCRDFEAELRGGLPGDGPQKLSLIEAEFARVCSALQSVIPSEVA
jgi:HPt (histidine-containing phosphotransfer) domain-containing protein